MVKLVKLSPILPIGIVIFPNKSSFVQELSVGPETDPGIIIYQICDLQQVTVNSHSLVRFYKVTANNKLVNTKPLPLGEIHVQVPAFSSHIFIN